MTTSLLFHVFGLRDQELLSTDYKYAAFTGKVIAPSWKDLRINRMSLSIRKLVAPLQVFHKLSDSYSR